MSAYRFISFDLEIAAIIPDEAQDWKQHRPLGITCSALAGAREDGTIVADARCGMTNETRHAPRMLQSECIRLVYLLMHQVNDGYTLLTFNGAGFDFDVLAEESGMHAECVELAANHVDMMLQVHCIKGYPVGLDAVARGMGLPGKTEGMTGAKAPQMWADGEYAKVLEYVQQDVRMTLEVALLIERTGALRWISKKGKPNLLYIPRWLTVQEALKLPLPDTGWMTGDRLTREKMTAWMEAGKIPG